MLVLSANQLGLSERSTVATANFSFLGRTFTLGESFPQPARAEAMQLCRERLDAGCFCVLVEFADRLSVAVSAAKRGYQQVTSRPQQESAMQFSGFVAIGSSLQERRQSKSFVASQLYGWNAATQDYTLCLFDCEAMPEFGAKPATGLWERDRLMLYVKLDGGGFLRYSYQYCEQIGATQPYRYLLQVEISHDGKQWMQCLEAQFCDSLS